MASFVGHFITGTAIYLYSDNALSKSRTWMFWLIFMAIFPDIDYGFIWLFGIKSDIRMTHSFIFSSILPVFTTIYLKLSPLCEYNKNQVIQAFGSAYSHLLLDVLTGVSVLPLLWPFTEQLFKLPFGILPSAGRLALTNWYLYRNLIIELGILLPIYSFILMGAVRNQLLLSVLHILIFILFLVWGIMLER